MTRIYHITHINNLSDILVSGCLWSDNERLQRGITTKGIAYDHIKQRRARWPVTTPPGGYVADYVPFYFAPRSPMLYTINRGNVEGYHEGQQPILHLVSSVEVIVEAGLLFIFTDGHATMKFSKYYCDPADLSQVDWAVMRARFWNDTDQDGDRLRRRQAEFLVHGSLPWNLVSEVGVINRSVATQVRAILARFDQNTTVTIQRNWYY